MAKFSNGDKFDLANSFIYEIFKEIKKDLNLKLKKIILTNMDCINYSKIDVNADKYTIAYKGNLYNHRQILFEGRVRTHVHLDPSLQLQMDEYIQEEKDLYIEEARISSYIKRGLNLCNDTSHIKQIFPEKFIKFFRYNQPDIRFHPRPPLSQEKIDRFINENKDAEAYLKQRLMKNFLLKK